MYEWVQKKLNGDEWDWMISSSYPFNPIQQASAEWVKIQPHSAPFSHNTHSSDIPWKSDQPYKIDPEKVISAFPTDCQNEPWKSTVPRAFYLTTLK